MSGSSYCWWHGAFKRDETPWYWNGIALAIYSLAISSALGYFFYKQSASTEQTTRIEARQVEQTALLKRLEIIDRARADVQRKLDESERRALFLVSGVNGTMESAATAARLKQNTELQLVAEKLRGLLRDFDSAFGEVNSLEISFTLRLARATAANAASQFTEALQLISDADVEFALTDASLGVEKGISALNVRADAYSGLGEWKEAQDSYDRILKLKPDHLRALLGAAESLVGLRRYSKALDVYSRWVSFWRIIHTTSKTVSGSTLLAYVFNNRGIVYTELGRYQEAVADFTESIGIYSALVRSGNVERLQNLALSLNNRSPALFAIGKMSEAIRDSDETITSAQTLISQGKGNLELTNLLAHAFNNRGNAKNASGLLPEATHDYDQAITILRRKEASGEVNRANMLAMALSNRGVVQLKLANWSAAISNYNEAIGIRRQLVNEGRTELIGDLAITLNLRGNVHVQLKNLPEAMRDLDAAVEFFGELMKENPVKMEFHLAGILCNRALALSSLDQRPDKLVQASNDCDKAIDIYQQLIANGHNEVEPDLARALDNRATVFALLNKHSEAIRDRGIAITVYERLYTNGRADLAEDLVNTRYNLGHLLNALGRDLEAIPQFGRAIDIARDRSKSGYLQFSKYLARALSMRAKAQALIGRPTEAIEDLDEAARVWQQLSPDTYLTEYAQVILNRALVHVANSNPLAAQRDTKSVIELKPNTEILEKARELLRLMTTGANVQP